MAMDHVQGRLASFERCPTALGSMVSMVKPDFINLLAYAAGMSSAGLFVEIF
jgi:hypothetical protein